MRKCRNQLQLHRLEPMKPIDQDGIEAPAKHTIRPAFFLGDFLNESGDCRHAIELMILSQFLDISRGQSFEDVARFAVEWQLASLAVTDVTVELMNHARPRGSTGQ